MDLLDLLRMIRRRWRPAALIVVLTVVIAVVLQRQAPSQFKAEGWLLLEPAVDSGLLADTPDEPAELARPIQVSGASFWVSPLRGQQFSVVGTARSAEDARATVVTVIADLQKRLAALQTEADVPAETSVEVRMSRPDIFVEPRDGGEFVATAEMYLFEPGRTSGRRLGANKSTASLLRSAGNSDAARMMFMRQGPALVGYAVSTDVYDPAPLIHVETVGPTANDTVEAFSVVRGLLAEQLTTLQNRYAVGAEQRTRLTVVSSPLAAEDTGSPFDRIVIGLLLFGALLAVSAAIVKEVVARRRIRPQRDGRSETLVAQRTGPVDTRLPANGTSRSRRVSTANLPGTTAHSRRDGGADGPL